MSVYTTGATAYRDTTKWLVAFVPISALLAAGVAAGPSLADSLDDTEGPAAFAAEAWPTLAAIGLVLVGISLIVWWGAKVLATQPRGFSDLLHDESELATAFGAGIAAPYFMDYPTFVAAMNALDAEFAKPADERDKLLLERSVPAVDAAREWSLQQQLADSFRGFAGVFVLGTVLVVAGLVVALADRTPDGPAVAQLTHVDVELSSAGLEDLVATTGCTPTTETEYWAIGGTWTSPVLDVAGPGCGIGARWSPEPDHARITLPAETLPTDAPDGSSSVSEEPE